jgi:hypothetical protein
MCCRLSRVNKLKRQIQIPILCIIAVVLAANSTAFVSIFLGLQPLAARILVAFGNCIAYGFLFCLTLVILMRGSQETTFLRKLSELVKARNAWGVLCCSVITFAAAVISMAFLKMSVIDQFLLVYATIIQS